MKKGLPRFVLLSDPYNSLEGRVLIMKPKYPTLIVELFCLDDICTTDPYFHETVRFQGKYYCYKILPGHGGIGGIPWNEFREILDDMTAWYFHSQTKNEDPKL